MVLERENAIAHLREIMGATDPAKAAAGTIRKDFAASIETQRHPRLGRAGDGGASRSATSSRDRAGLRLLAAAAGETAGPVRAGLGSDGRPIGPGAGRPASLPRRPVSAGGAWILQACSESGGPMSVKSDRWIRKMALEHRMIEPFADKQVREGVISYGLSSYGYDVRIADEFKIFTNINPRSWTRRTSTRAPSSTSRARCASSRRTRSPSRAPWSTSASRAT